MWILLGRAPPPDAPYWPGRRWLAALDAVMWPAGWAALIMQVPVPRGLVGLMLVSIAAWAAAVRVRRAIWANHRYRFTSWRWGRALMLAMVFGWALKVATHLSSAP